MLVQNIILSPLLFGGAFFTGIAKKYPDKKHYVNAVFVTFFSVIYGSIVGLYFTLFTNMFLNIKSISLDEIVIWFIIIFEVIQIAIVLKNQEEEYVFSKIYINILELVSYIVRKKEIEKFVQKFLLLTTVLFYLFMIFLSKFQPKQSSLTLLIIIIAFVSFSISALIFNRKKTNSFKKVLQQVILKSLLIIIPNVLIIFRIILYDISSIELLLEIIFILGSIISSLLSVSEMFNELYESFINEYHCDLKELHHELDKISGYNKVKKKVVREINFLKNTGNTIKADWNNGKRKRIIQFFATELFFIILFVMVIINIEMINNLMDVFYSNVISLISEFWLNLFNGNVNIASIVPLQLILLFFLISAIKKLITDIQEEKNIYEYSRQIIGIVYIIAFILILLPLIIEKMNSLKFAKISILLFLVTSSLDSIMKRIYKKNE